MRLARLMLPVLLLVAATVPSRAASDGSSQWPCPSWGMYGGNLKRTFATGCGSPIDRTSVGSLAPAWFYKTPKTVTATPAVVDGTVYVGDWSGTMYALRARNGTLRWTFKALPAPGAIYGPIVSSAAVADAGGRRLVIFGAGPRLYAVNAADATMAWVLYVGALKPDGRPLLEHDFTEIESSPVVWKGTVYVGMDTHDHDDAATGGVRGGLLAVDAASGKLKWKFEPELGAGKGCGGVWSSPTLDTERNLVFFGTANCPADFTWTRHTEAITALDATTGAVVWSFQPHKPNRNDWDFGATPNLFVDQAGREVLGAGNKDGVYYALDPATGKLLWSTKVAEPGDFGEDFAIGGFIGSPAAWGGKVFGGTAIGGPPFFHAIDAKTGVVTWEGAALPSYSASAVVNGVVFNAALDSTLKAWNSDTGTPLWVSPLVGPGSSGAAIVGDSVYIGSGTSSSDACAKDTPVVSDACMAVFDVGIAAVGGVHAFRLAG